LTERSNLISKLQSDFKTRAAYIHAKVSTLVPSQIKGLRLKSDMPRQKDLAQAAKLHQSRISMFETPGANPTVETLSAIAAALRVGLKIEFVPFSEMLTWENGFSQDQFNVTKIDNDLLFLSPNITPQPTPQAINTSWITMDLLRDLGSMGNTIEPSGYLLGPQPIRIGGPDVDYNAGAFAENSNLFFDNPGVNHISLTVNANLLNSFRKAQVGAQEMRLGTPTTVPVELLVKQPQERSINA